MAVIDLVFWIQPLDGDRSIPLGQDTGDTETSRDQPLPHFCGQMTFRAIVTIVTPHCLPRFCYVHWRSFLWLLFAL